METATDERFVPPYFAFQTLKSFIDKLAEKPLPPALDRSLMDNLSGSNQTYMLAALRGFGLIGPNNEVLPPLTEMVRADEPARKRQFADIVRRAYPIQMKVSDERGTEQALLDSFLEMGIKGETRRKAMTFFLNLARYAGIELSPHFPATRSGSGSPTAGTKRVRKRPPKPSSGIVEQGNASLAAPTSGDSQTVSLKSGGSVTVSVSVSLFALDNEDRTFVLDLIDRVRGYNRGSRSVEEGLGSLKIEPEIAGPNRVQPAQ